MMRAEESGQRAKHAASESLRQQTNINADERASTWREVGQGINQGRAQAEEQSRYESGAQERQAQMDFRREVATSEAAQRQQSIDLDYAQSGYERGEGGPSSPLLTDRAAKLDAEMQQGARETGAADMGSMGPDAQGESTQWADDLGVPVTEEDRQRQALQQAEDQRQDEQMGRSLSDSSYVKPTKERQQATQFKQSNEAQKREIERGNAAARMRKAQGDYRKSLFTKDKEARKQARDVLQVPLGLASKAFDEVMNGEPLSGASKKYLLAETEGHPVNEIVKNYDSAEDKGPLIEHLKNHVDKKVLDFFETTGESPNSEFVNWASPKLQTFMGNVAWVNGMTKAIGMGAYQGVRSMEERNRVINQIAAGKTKQGLVQPPAALGAAPQQQPQEPGSVMRQGMDAQGQPATPPTQQRGLTPDEQQRSSGLGTAPAGEQQPHIFEPTAGAGKGFRPDSGIQQR